MCILSLVVFLSIVDRCFIEEKRGSQTVASYCKNPTGSCAGIVLLADDAYNNSEACCSLCSTTFCIACDLSPHAPATCEMAAKWEQKGGALMLCVDRRGHLLTTS